VDVGLEDAVAALDIGIVPGDVSRGAIVDATAIIGAVVLVVTSSCACRCVCFDGDEKEQSTMGTGGSVAGIKMLL
jgi:hypothetical protein